jgi:hypothetical protein
MRRPEIISRLLIVAFLLALAGCAGPPAETVQVARAPEGEPTDTRGFDPLELPRDREVVPERYPSPGDISGRAVIIGTEAGSQADDSLSREAGMVPQPTDSVNSQAYRVQVFTSLVYGEAKQAARVAEEIFDQPVYIDYEVPNYKVRVGSWADRDTAERYQQKAREAGYGNAWVVMVKVSIREAAPLYDEHSLLPVPVPAPVQDTVTTDDEDNSAED